jgi:hypothetical protein
MTPFMEGGWSSKTRYRITCDTQIARRYVDQLQTNLMRITIADIQLLRKGLAKGGHKPTSHKILLEISLSLKHEQYAPRPRIVLRRAGI